MSTCILNFMCVKLNSLFESFFVFFLLFFFSVRHFVSEMKIYYFTQVLKQGFNIKTMCPNFRLEFRNTKTPLLQAYLGALGG